VNSNAIAFANRTLSNSVAYNWRISSNSQMFYDTAYDTHQVISSNTTHKNFKAFRAGFTVNTGITLTLDTPAPIMGRMSFGDGTGKLTLGGDVTFGAGAYMTTGAYIDGAGYSLALTSSFVAPAGGITFKGNTIIDAQNNIIEINSDSLMGLDASITVTIKNATLNISSGSGTAAPFDLASSSRLCFENVVVNLINKNTQITDTGRLYIHDNVIVRGPYHFIYKSTTPLYIDSGSTLYFGEGSTFNFQPSTQNAGNRGLVRMYDATSALYFDNATLNASGFGIVLINGSIVLDNLVTFSNFTAVGGSTLNTDSAKAITLGNGTSTYDVTVYVKSGARTVVNGYLYYNNAS